MNLDSFVNNISSLLFIYLIDGVAAINIYKWTLPTVSISFYSSIIHNSLSITYYCQSTPMLRTGPVSHKPLMFVSSLGYLFLSFVTMYIFTFQSMSHWPQWHSVGTFGACRGLILSPPSSSPASPVQGKVEGSSSTFSTFSSYQRPPMIRLIIQCRLSASSSPSCFASASPLLVAYNPFYLRMAATSFVLCALRLRCAFSAAGVLRFNGCLRVLCLNVCFNVGVTIDWSSIGCVAVPSDVSA
jgi:hypothetical protein